MVKHAPKRLEGPIIGTTSWWKELGDATVAEIDPTPRQRRKARRNAEREDKPIRFDLVNRIRKEIAQGTYDTPERWEAALDRLADTL
jgi:hypothetical protein